MRYTESQPCWRPHFWCIAMVIARTSTHPPLVFYTTPARCPQHTISPGAHVRRVHQCNGLTVRSSPCLALFYTSRHSAQLHATHGTRLSRCAPEAGASAVAATAHPPEPAGHSTKAQGGPWLSACGGAGHRTGKPRCTGSRALRPQRYPHKNNCMYAVQRRAACLHDRHTRSRTRSTLPASSQHTRTHTHPTRTGTCTPGSPVVWCTPATPARPAPTQPPGTPPGSASHPGGSPRHARCWRAAARAAWSAVPHTCRWRTRPPRR